MSEPGERKAGHVSDSERAETILGAVAPALERLGINLDAPETAQEFDLTHQALRYQKLLLVHEAPSQEGSEVETVVVARSFPRKLSIQSPVTETAGSYNHVQVVEINKREGHPILEVIDLVVNGDETEMQIGSRVFYLDLPPSEDSRPDLGYIFNTLDHLIRELREDDIVDTDSEASAF